MSNARSKKEAERPAAPDTSLGEVSVALARRWAQQRLVAVQAYGRILADYGAGHSTNAGAAGAYARLVAEEAVRYPGEALSLVTDFATALVREAGGKVEAASPKPAHIQDLEITGSIGSSASTEFLLKNPHASSARLKFVTSTFTGADGDTLAPVMVDPAEVMLAAGAEHLIKLSVAVDEGAFEAGRRYMANVAITGFDDLILRVRLSVLPR